VIEGAAATGNQVQGNFIGTAADGSSQLGNTSHGLLIADGASNIIIGGVAIGAGNIIAYNGNASPCSSSPDAAGNAYVTGFTTSSDFPTVNAFQPTLAGSGATNAFVAKLAPDGSALVYSGPGLDDHRRFPGRLERLRSKIYPCPGLEDAPPLRR
jgi:hypothetical protein